MFDTKIDFEEILNPYHSNFEVLQYYYNLYLNECDTDKKCALLLKIENLLKVGVDINE